MKRKIIKQFILFLLLLALIVPQSYAGVAYNVYYGQLHSHSKDSDGSGTPVQAYQYARDIAGLDFFSLADHCSYPYPDGITPSEYQNQQSVANSYNQDGVYVTFWGFEWTSDDTSWGGPPTLLGKGHITIINSPDHCNATDEATNDLNELVDWMSTRDVVAFFNHPGQYGTNFDNFNFNYSDKIVGMELWNRSTDYYGSGSWYHNALNEGFYIGATGGGDNHSADWGTLNEWRMAILAPELTRASLFEAMKARRFYSSRDKNLALSFTCNGAQMGSKTASGSLDVVIEASDGNSEVFSKIDLLKNGAVIQTWTPNITNPSVTTTVSGTEGDYFYVRVYQGGSAWAAISSPVFITSSDIDVDAGVDMITWSGQAVELDATVVVGEPPFTYAWSAEPDDGVVFSATDVEDPTVTITKAADNPSVVTLTLAVHDAANPPVEDTITIDVYDDACKAAIGAGLGTDNPGDFDGNCITDFEDFAVMATTWLDGSELQELAEMATTWLVDYTLTEPVPK
jgi:hypothetical protein